MTQRGGVIKTKDMTSNATNVKWTTPTTRSQNRISKVKRWWKPLEELWFDTKIMYTTTREWTTRAECNLGPSQFIGYGSCSFTTNTYTCTVSKSRLDISLNHQCKYNWVPMIGTTIHWLLAIKNELSYRCMVIFLKKWPNQSVALPVMHIHTNTIYGKNEDHIQQLNSNLETCRQNNVNLNSEKCIFLFFFGLILSYIICRIEKLPTPAKMSDIQQLEPPTTIRRSKDSWGWPSLTLKK